LSRSGEQRVERTIGIGIDVGGTKILLVAVERDGRPLDEIRIDSPGDLGGLRKAIEPALVAMAGHLDPSASVALGLALPGLVDASGTLRSAPNLDAPDVGFDLKLELAEPLLGSFGHRAAALPVALENDATAAAFAEARLGAGKGHDDVLVVSIGTGIGAGLVVGGKVVRGAHGYAGEIGHAIVDRNGPLCSCGRHGCWEQVASGSALARLGEASAIAGLPADRPVRGEDVVDAARRNDPAALAVLDEFAISVAIGLVNACEILDPSVIVLGGGLVTASDVVLEPIRHAFVQQARPAQAHLKRDLLAASLGPNAAAIGVALLALESI
jgi:glucokinase